MLGTDLLWRGVARSHGGGAKMPRKSRVIVLPTQFLPYCGRYIVTYGMHCIANDSFHAKNDTLLLAPCSLLLAASKGF